MSEREHRRLTVRLVLGRAAWLVLIGLAAGTGLSVWMTRYAAALLFSVEPRDPATLVGAAAVLGLVGVPAGWIPARRAARLDPAQTLRQS